MDLDSFINEAESSQQMASAYLNKEEIKARREAEKIKADWQRLNKVQKDIKKDFEMFDGVNFEKMYRCDTLYRSKLWRVYQTTSYCVKIEPRNFYGYSRSTNSFEAKNGNFCKEIKISECGGIWVQLSLDPKTEEITYFITNKYRTFDEVRQWLSLEKDKGYVSRPFDEKTTQYKSYKALKDALMVFLKKTINLEKLKEKHGKSNLLKLG